jgi:aryl-alcohol dehydrogenase-like predicted oxidoreductase
VGLAEMSIREKAGLLAYSPLAFGMLSGKYLNGQLPQGSRLQLFGENFPRYQGTRSQLAVEEYFTIATKHDLSLTQMSLAFVNMQEFVTSNIIGATSLDQLKENIDSVNLELTDEVLEDINKIHENNPSPAP